MQVTVPETGLERVDGAGSTGDTVSPGPSRRAHGEQLASTLAGARGSANVAVPTCTATAPASSSSVGVPARGDAADADDRQVGQGGVDVVHGAHGDRVDRRAGQPAAAGAERRPARRRVVGQAEQRVDARHRLGAGRGDGAGDLDDAVGVGAQLGPPRPAARRRWRR